MYDILIVGGGPAGMTAALYARRAGKSALLLEKAAFGGQMTFSPRIENYPGFVSVSGIELADQMMQQIIEQGAEVEMETVTEVVPVEGGFLARTESGAEFSARAVVLAAGARHRLLGLPGEEELIGGGISFCAVCDGDFYAGREVAVAGGGNSALQEALLLSDVCSRVTIVQDLPNLTGEARLQEALAQRENVRVLTGMRIEGLLTGADGLTGLIARNAQGEAQEIPCDGLFVAIGLVPDCEPFAGLLTLNGDGYVPAGEDCLTDRPGVFVAGDCRAKRTRQVATAIADGAVAALAACRYIDGH